MGAGKFEIADGNAAEGDKALKLLSGFACQDKRKVKGGQNYRISMMIRCEDTGAGGVYVQSSYRDNGVDKGWSGPVQVNLNDRSEPALLVTGGTHGWEKFLAVIQAPPGANQLLIYLRKSNNKGTAFFDDIRVEPSNDKPITAAERSVLRWRKNC